MMLIGTRLKKTIFTVMIGLSVFFVGGNITASQTLNPLYFELLSGREDSIVSYLIHIRSLSFFQTELLRYKNTRGVQIEEKVFKKEKEDTEKIAVLEKALEKNQKSRDILFALHVLYKQRGNESKALEYINKAKEIDPLLKP